MSTKADLADLVLKKHFTAIENTFRKHFKMNIETTDIDGNDVRSLCSAHCHQQFCKIIKSSRAGANRCVQDRQRSLAMAFQTGQPYISICHAGLMIVCVPIMDHENPLGGIFFGKCLTEPVSAITEADIGKRILGLKFDQEELHDAVNKLPLISSLQVHEAAEFLFILLYETTKLDPQVIRWQRMKTRQQADISSHIQHKKMSGAQKQYPYHAEQQLIGKVKIGDRTGAKEILNSLLGDIMFQNPGDHNVLKARLVELLSVLSRSAVEGGVDINTLLHKNLNYINTVINIDTQEDLCGWISRALNDFIDCVYEHQDSQKITRIKPAMAFIEEHYDQQLSLADIAKAAHLSVSRIAHLFKDEMGITIVDYITNIRINHAKQLLLATDKNCTQVCFSVGYNNQSYFTRTFKDLVGMTPRQFRKYNQRKKPIKSPL